MQIINSIPASIDSKQASAAKGGGTKIIDVLTPLDTLASKTVLNIGTPFESLVFPFPGVTPAEIVVP